MGIEQLVILVLIGLISLINWVVQKSADVRAKRKTEREEAPSESFHSLEESEPLMSRPAKENESRSPSGDSSMRQLMEALGVELPETEPLRHSPTPPSFPRVDAAGVPVVPPQLPSLIELANQFEARSPGSAGPGEFVGEKRPVHIKALPKPRVRKPLVPSVPSKRISHLLAFPGGVRNGIILSEVLGPPKAFRQD